MQAVPTPPTTSAHAAQQHIRRYRSGSCCPTPRKPGRRPPDCPPAPPTPCIRPWPSAQSTGVSTPASSRPPRGCHLRTGQHRSRREPRRLRHRALRVPAIMLPLSMMVSWPCRCGPLRQAPMEAQHRRCPNKKQENKGHQLM
jgi:hypothetical protein